MNTLKKICLISPLLATLGQASQNLINLDEKPYEERTKILNSIYVPLEFTQSLYQLTKDVVDVFTDAKIPHMASFGTILDLKRHYIKMDDKKIKGIKRHDDDVDLAVDLRDKEKILSLRPIFEKIGYKLVYDHSLSRLIVESKEKLKIQYNGQSHFFISFVDIFVYKEEDGEYVLAESSAREKPFLKYGWFTKEEFENRKPHFFAGQIKLECPKNAKDYLKRAYGKEWKSLAVFSTNHLNPHHRERYMWTLSNEERAPSLPLKKLEERYLKYKEEKYWNSFYKNNYFKEMSQPSSFAQFVLPYMKEGENLLELGCGNARDSFEFSKHKLNVLGIDSSDTIIQKNKEIGKALPIEVSTPSFEVCDVQNLKLGLKDKNFNHIYSRFFHHALTPENQQNVIDFYAKQKSQTYVYMEFRTYNDPLRLRSTLIHEEPSVYFEGIADDHYRCFTSFDQVLTQLKNADYEIIFEEEKNDISIVQKKDYVDNPFLGRIIAKKI